MTRYATVQEQDRACAAILVDNLYGYVKCEGRRWYVWDEQAWKWERATIVYGVSHRIVREVERLIIQAVMEDDFEEACVWRRYLYHGDIGIDPTDVPTRLTPHMSRIYRENQALLRQWG